MANVFVTAADLLQLADGNISDIDVSELLEDTPLLQQMSAIVASNSTSHEWLKKTAAPSAGFRSINDGLENAKAVYTKVTQALKLFDAGFDIDMGLLKAEGGEALKRREAVDHLRAAFVGMESQIIYGTDTDAVGFNGFADQSGVDQLSDEMVVNAGRNNRVNRVKRLGNPIRRSGSFRRLRFRRSESKSVKNLTFFVPAA